MIKKFLITAFIISLGISAKALASSPLQLSLTPDIAIHDSNETIKGLSLGLWGENPQNALAIGIAQGSTGKSSGISLAYLNYADSYRGIHWGLANYTTNEFTGWQAGFLNYTEGNVKGLQSGTINYANRLHGIQWGFINYAKTVESGLQVGMINIITESKILMNLPGEISPLMVFVNWKF
ncbi:MAG: hypothetical protein ACQEQC_07400 [Elusimicrobiota bacterium]